MPQAKPPTRQDPADQDPSSPPRRTSVTLREMRARAVRAILAHHGPATLEELLARPELRNWPPNAISIAAGDLVVHLEARVDAATNRLHLREGDPGA